MLMVRLALGLPVAVAIETLVAKRPLDVLWFLHRPRACGCEEMRLKANSAQARLLKSLQLHDGLRAKMASLRAAAANPQHPVASAGSGGG